MRRIYDEDLPVVFEALTSASPAEAHAKLEAHFGHRLGHNFLRDFCQRSGLKAPSFYCRRPDRLRNDWPAMAGNHVHTPPPSNHVGSTRGMGTADTDPVPRRDAVRPPADAAEALFDAIMPGAQFRRVEAEPDPVEERERRDERARDRKQIDRLVDELRQSRARQSFLDTISHNQAPPVILPRERSSGIREMTPIVLASDWHVEERVDPEAIAHRNAFDLSIADQRIRRFFDAIIWHIEHQRASGKIAIRDMVLWLGGDLMSGYIHEELVENNALSPTKTILWLMPRLRNGIYTLVNALKLDSLTIPCSFGNHGRTTQKPRISTGYANSYEWLMFHTLAQELERDKRIRFEITNSAHQYVQVYDRTLHFHHGDDIKYQGGVGGLSIPLLKAIPQWDMVKYADIHVIGHYHQLTDLGRVVVNGSLIGYGPYSQRIKATFEVPQQAMFYVDSKRGKCMPAALWLDTEKQSRSFAQAGMREVA